MLTAKPQDKHFQDADHNMQLSRVVTPKQNAILQQQSSTQQQPTPTAEAQQTNRKKTIVRKPTDLYCFILFVILQIASICIGVYGLISGDPNRLAKPYDPDHRACGVDGGVENYPFIFFATPDDKFLYRTVCVSECPTSKSSTLACAPNSVVTSCALNPSVNNLTEAVLVYDTIQYNSVCLPTTQYYYLQLQDDLYPGSLQQGASDLNNSILMILLGAVISLVLSCCVMLVAERFSGCIVWTFLVLFILTCIVSGSVSLRIYQSLDNPPQLNGPDTAQVSSSDLNASAQSTNALEAVFMVVGIVGLVLGILTLVMAICFRKRISLTIIMVKVAGDFVKTNKLANVVPVISSMLVILFTVWWLKSTLFLLSAMPVSQGEHQLPFEQVPNSPAFMILIAFHLLGLLWYYFFFIGCVEFVLSGGVADWYYRQGSDRFDANVDPILDSWARLKGYHFGTVALGSILIAVVSPIRFFLEYIHKLASESKGNNIVSTCCCCCLCVYNGCLKLLSKYAYVMVNLTGKGFFGSARQVIEIIEKDLPTFVLVGGLGEIFVTVGRLFLASLPASLCYYMAASDRLLMPYVPATICFMISFTISSTFMAVYGMSAEAIYLVYIYSQQFIDEEEIPQSTYTFQSFLNQAQSL